MATPAPDLSLHPDLLQEALEVVRRLAEMDPIGRLECRFCEKTHRKDCLWQLAVALQKALTEATQADAEAPR